jgi:hypothetical protein
MLKGLIEIYKIMKWHKKTFPEYTSIGQKKKVRDEAKELVDIFNNYTKCPTKYREILLNGELVDVIISSINAMRFEDVRQEVNEKMKENHKRSWKNGQHKR